MAHIDPATLRRIIDAIDPADGAELVAALGSPFLEARRCGLDRRDQVIRAALLATPGGTLTERCTKLARRLAWPAHDDGIAVEIVKLTGDRPLSWKSLWRIATSASERREAPLAQPDSDDEIIAISSQLETASARGHSVGCYTGNAAREHSWNTASLRNPLDEFGMLRVAGRILWTAKGRHARSSAVHPQNGQFVDS